MSKQTNSISDFYFIVDENVAGAPTDKQKKHDSKLLKALDAKGEQVCQSNKYLGRSSLDREITAYAKNGDFNNKIAVIITMDDDYAAFNCLRRVPVIAIPHGMKPVLASKTIREALSNEKNINELKRGGFLDLGRLDKGLNEMMLEGRGIDFGVLEVLRDAKGNRLKEYFRSKAYQGIAERSHQLVKKFKKQFGDYKSLRKFQKHMSDLSTNNAFESKMEGEQKIKRNYMTYIPKISRKPAEKSMGDGKGVEIIYPCSIKKFRVNKKPVLYGILHFDILGCKGKGHYLGGLCIGKGTIKGAMAKSSKIAKENIILVSDVGQCSGTLVPPPKTPPLPPKKCECKVIFKT